MTRAHLTNPHEPGSNQIRVLVLLACMLGLSAAVSSLAGEVKVEGARKCIGTRMVKRTEVVDDQIILFFTRGRTVYVNILPRECKGLSRDRRFSYSTSFGRLCKLDSIRILRDIGSRLEEGRSCRLGSFQPIDKKDIVSFIDMLQKSPQPQLPSPPGPVDIIVETGAPRDSAPK